MLVYLAEEICLMSDDTFADPMSPAPTPDLDSTLSDDEMRRLLNANNLSHFSSTCAQIHCTV